MLWILYFVTGTVAIQVSQETYSLQWNYILGYVWNCVCDLYMILVPFAFLIPFDGLGGGLVGRNILWMANWMKIAL